MKLLSTAETAKAWGVHPSRVQALLKEGRIPGAFKVGRAWAIPEGTPNPAGKTGKPKKA